MKRNLNRTSTKWDKQGEAKRNATFPVCSIEQARKEEFHELRKKNPTQTKQNEIIHQDQPEVTATTVRLYWIQRKLVNNKRHVSTSLSFSKPSLLRLRSVEWKDASGFERRSASRTLFHSFC